MIGISQLRLSLARPRVAQPHRWAIRVKSVVLSVLVVFLCGAPPCAEAESWVEVRGGHFAVPTDALGRIRATIESQVMAAAKARGHDMPPWREYLIQYRATEVHGHRAVEIHGSCHFDRGTDLGKEFYDEQVMDGGACFFYVFYQLDSGRYSNVAFHGYA